MFTRAYRYCDTCTQYKELTVIERFAVASDDVESGAYVESVLHFVPQTLAMLAAVTQLYVESHRRSHAIACVIGAESTANMPVVF